MKEGDRLDLVVDSQPPLENRPDRLQRDPEPLGEALKARSPESRKAFVVSALRKYRATLTREKQAAGEREANELHSKKARFMVPTRKRGTGS